MIYTIAPSPLQADTIWIGTDDGLIHVTHDSGKTWKNVTPPELTAWSKVSLMEASHSDATTAYAAVDRHRLEDYKPYIYRTRDGGKTWKLIANGIPDGSYVNSMKEDPARKGLLFAGTELGVYVSFNDGEDWQPLQNNLPHSSARDFAIHGDDLIVATHGRGFWMIDNISSLRQIAAMNAAPDTMLFKPVAIRMRTGGSGGTPLPYGSAETDNPPTGAILDYYLTSAASGPVTLEILDANGKAFGPIPALKAAVVAEGGAAEARANIPAYWNRPPETLSAAAGMHRWVWDIHYAAGADAGGGRGGRGGGGSWALPGNYRETDCGRKELHAAADGEDGSACEAPLLELQRQFDVAQQVAAKSAEVAQARGEVTRVRAQIATLRKQVGGNRPARSARCVGRKGGGDWRGNCDDHAAIERSDCAIE